MAKPLQLAAKPGDVQALKACIAAAASGTAIELVSSSTAAAAASAGASPSVICSDGDGLQLTEPNAAALYIGGRCKTVGGACDQPGALICDL